MAVAQQKIVIVGCGPGGPEYVTPAARDAVSVVEVVLGSERLLALFPESASRGRALPAHVEPAISTIEECRDQRRLAVLVSGDPGLFSLAKAIVEHFGHENCEVIPGVSSVQVAFARLGLPWTDARIVSAHGKMPNVSAEELAPCDKIAILGGTRQAIEWVAAIATDLRATHSLFLCENLTHEDERVVEVEPDALAASSLSIMVLLRKGQCIRETVGRIANPSSKDIP